MSLSLKEGVVFDLTGGLVTEAGPLTFPLNASKDEQNLLITEENARRRRKGLAYETDTENTLLPTFTLGEAAVSLKWGSVNDTGSVAFVVQQIGTVLWFYEDISPYNENRKAFTVDLTGLVVDPSQEPENYRIQGAVIDGNLLITSPVIHPTVISYDPDEDRITVATQTIFVRDILGVDDGLTIEAKPTVLSDEHNYNLQNQGWTEDLIDQVFSDKGYYPANSMISFLGKIPSPTTNVDEFSSDQLIAQLFGRVSAPKGHFILDFFDPAEGLTDPISGTVFQILSWSYSSSLHEVTLTLDATHGMSVTDEIRISGNSYEYTFEDELGHIDSISGSLDGDRIITAVPAIDKLTFALTVGDASFVEFVVFGTGEVRNITGGQNIIERPEGETILARPGSCYTYAGRVWYGYRNFLLFSQIVDSPEQVGFCYSIADPTSEHISSPSDADGGYIKVQALEESVGWAELGPYLLAIGSNGVWQIGGGQDSEGSFRPTNFFIKKLSAAGCVSAASITPIEGSIFFAGYDGVYRVGFDQNGFPRVENITLQTIHTRYTGISADNKRGIQAVYDPTNRLFYLGYGVSGGVFDPVTKMLVLNGKKNCWTPYSVEYETGQPAVVSFTTVREPSDTTFKFKAFAFDISGSNNAGWADFNAEDFLEFGENDAEAFLITGHDIMGLGTRFKQAPVIETYMKRTETEIGLDAELNLPSACDLTPLFDFNDAVVSGKVGPTQNIYRFDRPFAYDVLPYDLSFLPSIICTQNVLRGSGRALSLKFESQAGKDMVLYGWSVVKSVPLGK